jgi:hypothetical protein
VTRHDHVEVLLEDLYELLQSEMDEEMAQYELTLQAMTDEEVAAEYRRVLEGEDE